MINLSNEVQQIADNADPLDQSQQLAPEWVTQLKPQVLAVMRRHTQSGELTHVQYDVNPNEHSLEKYNVVLFNNEPATIFVAYARQTANDPKFYVTIHLTTTLTPSNNE